MSIHPSLTTGQVTAINDAKDAWRRAWDSQTMAGMDGADQCLAVIKSFDLELKTGVAHCACCLKPVTAHSSR